MGLVRQVVGGAQHPLSARTLFGRAGTCAVRVADGRISSEHAVVAWRDGRWWVRDLASRNGSRLEGEVLVQGVDRPWALGAVLDLAGVAFELLDDAPPVPSARDLDSGALLVGRGDVLLLPGEEAPLASIGPGAEGWLLDGDDPRTVADQEEVALGARRYRLFLPTAVAPTAAVSDLGLTLRVSSDEERVQVELVSGTRRFPLRPRAHHYLLLTLARVRLAARDAALPERGWVHREELARMLRCDRVTVNVQLHRIRLDLGSQGVEGAAALLESRGRTGHARVATDAIEVVPA